MSDFSDRPFVAGNLTGVRSFRIDSLGRLTGVHFREVWRPGENTATCRMDQTGASAGRHIHITFAAFMRTQALLSGSPIPPAAVLPAGVRAEPKEKEQHRAGVSGCSCGYYAYFDGSDDHADTVTVTGLIEAHGLCTVGSRGFRAEKASIVGLIQAKARPPLRDTAASAACAFVWVAGLLLLLFDGVPWWSTIFPILTGGFGLTWFGGRALDEYKDRRASVLNLDRVRANYPDVPVYPSLAAALRQHPLTIPPTPTADTDDDFWTRGAS